MTDAITVRPATAEDFDGWIELFERVASEGKWLGSELPFDRESRRQGYEATLANPDHTNFVALSPDGRYVGQLFMGVQPSGVADLGMAVDADWRGKGVGSALMQAGLEFAKGHGAHKIALQLWPHNTAAQALYEKFGFHVEGRFRRHWRRRSGALWDAVVMGLVLDEDSPGSPY